MDVRFPSVAVVARLEDDRDPSAPGLYRLGADRFQSVDVVVRLEPDSSRSAATR
jgi:hypothetical protein